MHAARTGLISTSTRCVGGDKSSEVLKYLETIKPTPERSREMANRMRMATSKQAKSAKSAKSAKPPRRRLGHCQARPPDRRFSSLQRLTA